MLRTKVFNLSEKTILVRRISDIEDKCYIDVLKLLIKEDIKYTRNSNGVFFDVGLLSDDVLTKLDNILKFYEMKRKKCLIVIYRKWEFE